MFDLSSKFKEFYDSCVVLPQDKQTDLTHKKDLNIERLKDGLKEYNDDHGTNFRVVETCTQGSMAMHTIVQNEDKNYDIDVAVVFDANNLGNLGPLQARRMVADALSRKTKQFNAEPEVKTSCVRIKYEDGYHIDIPVFKRIVSPWTNKIVYKHAGETWADRDIHAIKEWFDFENAMRGDDKLRKVVRLSKMFCHSRDTWKVMPSGLLQTVLCQENLASQYDRLDELFYHTMVNIVSRLDSCTKAYAPVDNGRDLTPRQIDVQRLEN